MVRRESGMAFQKEGNDGKATGNIKKDDEMGWELNHPNHKATHE